MLGGMTVDSNPPRDDRLDRALECLRKPERKPAPAWTALAASTALAGSAVLLALVMIFQPGAAGTASRTEQKIDIPQATPASGAAGFELSGNEISADAVATGTEAR